MAHNAFQIKTSELDNDPFGMIFAFTWKNCEAFLFLNNVINI